MRKELRFDKELEFNREKALKHFYDPIEIFFESAQVNLKRVDSTQAEKTQIEELSKTQDYDFAIIVDNTRMECTLFYGQWPFKGDRIDTITFLDNIQWQYLIPYLIYARLGYELAQNPEVSVGDIFNASYKIWVPLQNHATGLYHWYTQRAHALMVDDQKRVLRHINFYKHDSPCLTLNEGTIEGKFIQATVLESPQAMKDLQSVLLVDGAKFVCDILKERPSHWQLIEELESHVDLTLDQIIEQDKSDLTGATLKTYHNHIRIFLWKCTGYKFSGEKDVRAFCKRLRSLLPPQELLSSHKLTD